MKLIVDAHLPKKLIHCFKEHEVILTSDWESGNQTPDQLINELSLKKAAVITKDTDFYIHTLL